ncbi:MAG: N-acetylglucosamine-6-phosphate deacetylase [Pelotomaculum sp. PtaU1.Bin035]|nr:MAG: N-acetylglucosamine-6-phosphate deacetylase [Pelotomaculum sp. PtaU1.Bin035]
MVTFVNCDIYTGDEVIFNRAVLVKNDIIVDIITYDKIKPSYKIIDLKQANIVPGFIDLQVNGGNGVLFNDQPTVDSLRKIVQGHSRFGTTDILPTFITDDPLKMKKAVKAVRYCLDNKEEGILGIHFEGPFISPEMAGVHDIEYIIDFDDSVAGIMTSLKKGVTYITIAPERLTRDQIQKLSGPNIKLAVGHSNADSVQMGEAFRSGITGVTHLFNVMSQMQQRSPGVVGSILADDNEWASIIVDGYHVDFVNVRAAWKAKRGKLFLVTDAMPPVGSTLDEYKIGPVTIYYKHGKCVTSNGLLGGSGLDMATAVRNCIQKVGIEMPEAFRMASTYPAQFIETSTLGFIKPGYKANMTICNNDINVSGIVRNGVYHKFVN